MKRQARTEQAVLGCLSLLRYHAILTVPDSTQDKRLVKVSITKGDQHLVINGASQLLLDVFGEVGVGARSAVGMAQLPLGSATEVEMILELVP